MGAWGSGSFENDTAMDFADRVESLADIEAAFVIEGEEEIDPDAACEAIAAGECIAAMRGHPHPEMPEDLATKVAKFGKPTMALFDLARNNVSAAMSRGELVELWAEADDEEKAGFNRAMTDLVQRLGKPQAKPGKAKKSKKAKKLTPNPSPCMICDKPMGDGEFHMIDITLQSDEYGSMKQGGWVHMGCLNAALHPKHMIQNWQVDEELLDYVREQIKL